MLKQSISRNQRSKGFKVKHAVQICCLFAIGIWLLYNSKHSHGQNANDERTSSRSYESTSRFLRFGRKQLKPKIEEKIVSVGKEGHVEEEKPGENDEGIRLGAGGGGDDEIDGRDQFRAEEEEVDEEEDIIEEEDEVEEESEDDETEAEGVGSSEDQEAREKHYNGDDASSAVVENTQKVRVQQLVEEAEEKQSNTTRVVRLNDSQSTIKPILDPSKTSEHKKLDPNPVLSSTSIGLNSQKRYLEDSSGDIGNSDTVKGNDSTFESRDSDEDGEEEEVEEGSDVDFLESLDSFESSFL